MHDLSWVKTGDLNDNIKSHNLSIRHKNYCTILGIIGNANIMTQLDDETAQRHSKNNCHVLFKPNYTLC